METDVVKPGKLSPFSDGVFSDRNSMLVVGLVAVLLPPLAVVFNGLRCGKFSPASSVSQNYFTGGHSIFVGCMCIVGVLLLAYQGWRKSSNRFQGVLAKIAAAGAFGVGLIPTKLDNQNLRGFTVPECNSLAESLNSIRLTNLPGTWEPVLHGICAFILFAWLIYVVWTQFTEKSGDSVERCEPDRKEFRNKIYRSCVCFMVLGILICFGNELASFFTKGKSDIWSILFVGETIALLAFGVAWLVKSRWLWGYNGQQFGYLRSN